MSRLRDRLRFGFVLFHLTAVTVLSVPAPVGARLDATWKERHVRSQVLEWVAPFRSLLGDRSDEQVLTLTRAVATRILNVRDLVIAPFVPYSRAVGAGQGWQMFGSLNDQPARLRIRVAPAPEGPWETLYLARDPAHAWQIGLMDEERTRAAVNDWSWERGRAEYESFAARIAERVAADRPDARFVELAMMRFKVPAPDDLKPGVDPPEKERWLFTVPVNGLAP